MPKQTVQSIAGVVEAVSNIGESAAFVRLSPICPDTWTESKVLLALEIDPNEFVGKMVFITKTETGRFF